MNKIKMDKLVFSLMILFFTNDSREKEDFFLQLIRNIDISDDYKNFVVPINFITQTFLFQKYIKEGIEKKYFIETEFGCVFSEDTIEFLETCKAAHDNFITI